MADIFQISWIDPDHDIRRYPAVLDGIRERLHAPSAEYVVLDTDEQIQELYRRMAEHVPSGKEPYISRIYAGTGSAREIWKAMITPV